MSQLNANGIPLSVCTACDIHHYDNCTTCFGFGLRTSDTEGLLPVRAAQAHRKEPVDGVACPECRSTIRGVRGVT